MKCAVKLAWFMHDNPKTIGVERYGSGADIETSDKLSNFIYSLMTEECKERNRKSMENL